MLQQKKQKTIAWTKIYATRKWEHLQSDTLIRIKLTLKPTFVKLVSFKLFVLLGIRA
jgi:hypothetical protein